jgi:hypothetical protein
VTVRPWFWLSHRSARTAGCERGEGRTAPRWVAVASLGQTGLALAHASNIPQGTESLHEGLTGCVAGAVLTASGPDVVRGYMTKHPAANTKRVAGFFTDNKQPHISNQARFTVTHRKITVQGGGDVLKACRIVSSFMCSAFR